MRCRVILHERIKLKYDKSVVSYLDRILTENKIKIHPISDEINKTFIWIDGGVLRAS